VAPLTPEELQPVVREAIAIWAAAGIDAGQVSALNHVAVGIADFHGPWLGMAFPGAIWIDQDAAGYGWYIDATPGGGSAFPAVPGSPAYGKVDLLTVVEHELGHELGLDDTPTGGLMAVFLPTGTRRLPAALGNPDGKPEVRPLPGAIVPGPAGPTLTALAPLAAWSLDSQGVGDGDLVFVGGPVGGSVQDGGGNPVLVGGDGDSLQLGSAGRDLLLGGIGSCASGTALDQHDAALVSVVTEWPPADALAT
jgi:hypothetical protein